MLILDCLKSHGCQAELGKYLALLESLILFRKKEVYGQLGMQTATKTQNVQIYGHQDLPLDEVNLICHSCRNSMAGTVPLDAIIKSRNLREYNGNVSDV